MSPSKPLPLHIYASYSMPFDDLGVKITSTGDSTTWVTSSGRPLVKKETDFIPEKIIYNGKYTICYFKDGSKTISHPSKDEEYSEDVGVMACIIKKMFGTRSHFMRHVESGYRQPEKDK